MNATLRTATWQRLAPGELPPRWPWLFRWVEDGREGTAVKLLDVASGREVAMIPKGTIPKCSPDGRRFAIREKDGTIAIWDMPPRKPLGLYLGLSGPLVALVVGAGLWRRFRRR